MSDEKELDMSAEAVIDRLPKLKEEAIAAIKEIDDVMAVCKLPNIDEDTAAGFITAAAAQVQQTGGSFCGHAIVHVRQHKRDAG